MTTTDVQTEAGLLSVAHQLSIGTGESPRDLAHRRSWIDARGQVTPAGRALMSALGDQRGTRSVFRWAV
ncbi:hypothetical protein [Roseospira navarrensis]|uniref:Uncharacterized protein n=1 Tax=Roseospira navarrensis TaxID=140058 RepID=A0A7X1ZDW2_9PROT|nr:hypothetical protein [Roseospira navarrensis]MQX36748.1 hypothetical protein [Roseospira navarrensis]